MFVIKFDDIYDLIIQEEPTKCGIYECDIIDNKDYKYPVFVFYMDDNYFGFILNIYKLPTFLVPNGGLKYVKDILLSIITYVIDENNSEMLFAIFTSDLFKNVDLIYTKNIEDNLLFYICNIILTKISCNLDYIITNDEYNIIQYIITLYPQMTNEVILHNNRNCLVSNIIPRTPHNLNNSVNKLRDCMCGEIYWNPRIHGLINPELKYMVGTLTKYFNKCLLNKDVIEYILCNSIQISKLHERTYTIGDILEISGLNKVSIADRMIIGTYAGRYGSYSKANVLIKSKHIIYGNVYYIDDVMDIQDWIINNIDNLKEIDVNNPSTYNI